MLLDEQLTGYVDYLRSLAESDAATSLPVFTVSGRDRLANVRSYAERVIESLFDKLIDADNLIWTGRLYLP
jgi:hypothetical protein